MTGTAKLTASLKGPETFVFADGRINNSLISKKKTESDKKSSIIVPDRPKLQKSSNYVNAVHILKHGTANNVPESKHAPSREKDATQIPERSNVESPNDDDFWKEDLLRSPLAVIHVKSRKNQTIISSNITHQESPNDQRQYLLKRSKRDLSNDYYLHRSSK